MQDIINRLKEHFMVATDKDLREEIEVKRPTFDLWKKNNEIPDRAVKRICKKHGFNLKWFNTGAGEKLSESMGEAS